MLVMLQWKTAFGPFFCFVLGFVGVFRLVRAGSRIGRFGKRSE
jgi:hypothetical protein